MTDDNTTTETLYGLSPEAMASQEAFQRDAEDRNIERGCTCAMPIYRHDLSGWPIVRCFVEHTDRNCPRRPA